MQAKFIDEVVYAQRFKLLKLGQLGGDPAFKLVAGEVATQPKASESTAKAGIVKAWYRC